MAASADVPALDSPAADELALPVAAVRRRRPDWRNAGAIAGGYCLDADRGDAGRAPVGDDVHNVL